MSNAGTWFAAIMAAIGIVTFLGAAAVYLRGSKDKGTISTLESNNKALASRVDILEASEEALLIRVDALEKANSTLREMVTSRADIAELATVIDHHNTFVGEWTEKVDGFMGRVDAFIKWAKNALNTLLGRSQ